MSALVDWAVSRWNAEVKNRPLVNVHRRSLDTTWRQVIRHFGGDDVGLCGPSHDELMAAAPPRVSPEGKHGSRPEGGFHASNAQPWPDPTPEMLNGDPVFDAIWNAIKTWDINVPHAYSGYCGATGNHARAIYDALPRAT